MRMRIGWARALKNSALNVCSAIDAPAPATGSSYIRILDIYAMIGGGAVLFDAGHTLLEFDYALLTAQLTARGHDVTEARVTEAERRARIALDTEQANQPTRARLGAGRYLRYLLGGLGISSDEEVAAITAWRRAFNLPIGLCHQADAQAVEALTRLRAAGLVTGVISNSNGSVRQALERAGLAPAAGLRHRLHGGRHRQARSPGVCPGAAGRRRGCPRGGLRRGLVLRGRGGRARRRAGRRSVRSGRRVGRAGLSQRGWAERGRRPRYRTLDVVSRTPTT